MLARHCCTLVRGPCSELVSSQPLRGFNAALSPDQLSERIGADCGNRTPIIGVARPSGDSGPANRPNPHGRKSLAANLWWEADGIEPLAQRDCVYSAATAPAILIGASRIDLRHRPDVRRGCADVESPPSPCGLRRGKLRRAAAKFGGELRVRTSVLADPSVFGTDCRPLQRRSP